MDAVQNLMKPVSFVIARESLPEVTHYLCLAVWSRSRSNSGLLKITGIYANRRWSRGHSPMWSCGRELLGVGSNQLIGSCAFKTDGLPEILPLHGMAGYART